MTRHSGHCQYIVFIIAQNATTAVQIKGYWQQKILLSYLKERLK